MIRLANKEILLDLSEKTGEIMRLVDKANQLTFIDKISGRTNREAENESQCAPFLIRLDEEFTNEFLTFTSEYDSSSIRLHWQIRENIFLDASIKLNEDRSVTFNSQLQNTSSHPVPVYQFPVIRGIGQISDEDYLVHSYATGVMIKNPLQVSGDSLSFLRYIPYPEGFSGATMQFFSYFGQNRGGLYFAAEDPDACQKWLNIFPDEDGMTASLMIGFEDIRPGSEGAGLSADFPFVLRLMSTAPSWYEAAATYKSWATEQQWCARGKTAERLDEIPEWLYKKIGLSTFGVNAGHDRSLWLAKYHEDIGVPIFHMLGPDWTNVPQTFGSGVPGGYDDWLPTRFSRETLQAIRDNNDYYAPFEFDFLVDPKKSDGEKLRQNLIRWPDPVYSHDRYKFNMLCPCTEFTRNFHVRRDLQIYREAQPDSMYYDISANNLLRCCLSTEHGHKPGGAGEMTRAYKEIYRQTREAISREAGRPFPLGTEMINEVFLPELDYYQARAWAQPSSTLETWPMRDLMKSGTARMIPLFTYVYNEYGAVRFDGWGKLVRETGSYFFDIVAKTYLWGGIYEINHEYSPMEAIEGKENSSQEHYFAFDPHNYAYAPDRARYVRQFAALRTREANPYLAFGQMRPELETAVPEHNLEWFHYNHGKNDTYHDSGTFAVPVIRQSVWRKADGEGCAVFLINTGESSRDITITIGPEGNLKEEIPAEWQTWLYSRFDPEEETTAKLIGPAGSLWPDGLQLRLASRQVYMLEFKPILKEE